MMNDSKQNIRHQDREHAIVSPSSLKRILACPTSLKANEGINKAGKAAAQGTLAHEVAEYFVKKCFGIEPSIDIKDIKNKTTWMLDCGSRYMAFASMIKQNMESTSKTPVKVKVEERVSCEELIPECWGTCDAMFIGRDRLAILDYKFGQIEVKAEDNAQLKAYALGAFLSLTEKQKQNIHTIETYIFQPNIGEKDPTTRQPVGSYDMAKYTPQDLIDWAVAAKPIVEDALNGTDKAKAGDHCMFCAAKGSCHTRNAEPDMHAEWGNDGFGK